MSQTQSDRPALIGVDWGTSQMRLYLLGAQGQRLASRQSARGLLTCPDQEAFARALQEEAADWLQQSPALPILMAGMVGSRQGWRETPYLSCPLDPRDLANQLVALPPLQGHPIAIVPGLRGTSPAGLPDVMRGEETQLIGAIDFLADDKKDEDKGLLQDATLCLPGTHAKWVQLQDGIITHFATSMTGEAFALWSTHGLLSRWIQQEPQEDAPEAFVMGVTHAQRQGGLLHHLFGVRALSLAGQLPVPHQRAYLSGLLIGHELREALPLDRVLFLVGAQELCARYLLACKTLQQEVRILDGETAVTRGLCWLSRHSKT